MIFEEEYEIVRPGCCGQSFAFPKAEIQRKKKHNIGWHCPHCGASRIFTGKTEEQQRIEKLERHSQHLEQEAIRERERAERVSNQYTRMRKRIQNGVCPCCNRTFQNLVRHMATKHPDTDRHTLLHNLRVHLGMTQADLAHELDIPMNYVSLFENKRRVPKNSAPVIDAWLDTQMGES